MERKPSVPSFALRGQRGNLAVNGWVMFAIVLAISVVSFVVLSILLGAFKSSDLSCPSGYTFNASANKCYTGVNGTTVIGVNYAANITDYGLLFISNTTAQLGTAGTLLGVSLLLVIIAGVGFAGYTAYQKMR